MGSLAEKLAAMPEEKRLYMLSSFPQHLAISNETDRLRQILTNFHFLLLKVHEQSLGSELLLSDFELLHDPLTKIIQRAIQRSSYVLSDSAQFGGQLIALLSSRRRGR